MEVMTFFSLKNLSTIEYYVGYSRYRTGDTIPVQISYKNVKTLEMSEYIDTYPWSY